MEHRYLFGKPVRPTKPTANGPREVFVLGAYPSALHVRWHGPDDSSLIRAIAVDNEPEPFWTGDGEEWRIEEWEKANFRDEWGQVKACGKLNGSSGAWLQDNVLKALGFDRNSAWITDCLDTYCESVGAAYRLDSEAIATQVRALGIPARRHARHPSESDIVRLALAGHRQRLIAELNSARPELIVTLGNAALRVFRALAQHIGIPLQRLSIDGYGTPIPATVNGRHVLWLPLAHPAAPGVYQEAHRNWRLAQNSAEAKDASHLPAYPSPYGSF